LGHRWSVRRRSYFANSPRRQPTSLLDASIPEYVALIEGCELFKRAPRVECYRWLGKTLAVVTDGAFGEKGCSQLRSGSARRECLAGAASMDDALVTFS
jgi:hypothetical protein